MVAEEGFGASGGDDNISKGGIRKFLPRLGKSSLISVVVQSCRAQCGSGSAGHRLRSFVDSFRNQWIFFSHFGRTFRFLYDVILDVPEEAGFVDVVDFDVGEGGLVFWAVVDEFFTSVNQAVVPHFFESFIRSGDDVFVESESQVVPGAAGAEGAELEFHVSPLFFDEVPDASVEFVTRVFEAGVSFLFELTFVNDPSFEAGVVGSRDVPGCVAFHAVITSQRVFDSDCESVTDVEVAVSIRGRHDDRVSF